MKNFLITFLSLFSMIATLPSYGQSANFCKQLELVRNAVRTTHYRPKPIDNELASGIYSLFINFLDDDRVNFTQAQVDSFSHLEKNMDNAIRNNDCSLLNIVTAQYKSYIEARLAFLKEQLVTSQDYTGVDQLVSKSYKSPNATAADSIRDASYFDSDKSRITSWSKFLRLEILSRISRAQPTLKQANANFKEEELRIRTLMINQEICDLESMIKDGTIDIAIEEIFLHCFLTYHDPHSAFFNASEKQNYESDIATDQETYGLYVDKNSDDEFFIAHLIPGSSAYNSILQEKDIVLSITANNKEKEFNCTTAYDINLFLSNVDHKSIQLEIRKKSGATKKVTLLKRLAAVEQNAVTGYILGDSKTTGYIKIPSFYTDLEENYGLGIANDVATEIYKLQKQHIAGLILDLRGNGGGSLKEAVDLVGIFIDRGPISILEFVNEQTDLAMDFNNGAGFKKPLVVLVDADSASASELFAATIKEYGRGVIVGQPTYGKATVQNVDPLSTKDESLGFVKITKGAFYNIDGTTHQGDGVQPDILVPMLGNSLIIHEKDEPFALSFSNIKKLKDYTKTTLPLEKLIAASTARVNANSFMQQIAQQDSQIKNIRDTYPDKLSIDLKSVYAMISNREKSIAALTQRSDKPLLEVSNLELDILRTQLDAVLEEQMTAYRDLISRDPQIHESFLILQDLKNWSTWNN